MIGFSNIQTFKKFRLGGGSFLYFATALIFGLFLSAEEKQSVYNYDAGPQAQCKLSVASFRLWIPPEADSKVNGVLVVTPGRNKDGRSFVQQEKFRELASKWGFAIMGNYLKGTAEDKDTYQLDFKGNTAGLLVNALEKFAEISKRDELKTAPLFLFGLSAGGNVSVQFPGFYPERTIGVAAFVPTAGPGINASKKLNIPMLVCIGARDRKDWVRFSDIVWGKYGSKSVWTYAKHKELGHEGRQAFDFGFVYIDAVLKKRLVPDGEKGFKNTLSKLEAAWEGNLNSYDVQKAASAVLAKDTCWLPDEVTAIAWRKYLNTSFRK